MQTRRRRDFTAFTASKVRWHLNLRLVFAFCNFGSCKMRHDLNRPKLSLDVALMICKLVYHILIRYLRQVWMGVKKLSNTFFFSFFCANTNVLYMLATNGTKKKYLRFWHTIVLRSIQLRDSPYNINKGDYMKLSTQYIT